MKYLGGGIKYQNTHRYMLKIYDIYLILEAIFKNGSLGREQYHTSLILALAGWRQVDFYEASLV